MFWRLFLIFGGLLCISIGPLGFVIVHRVESSYLEQIEGSLRSKAILVREVILDRPTQPANLQQQIHDLGKETGARITLIRADGLVLADSHRNPRTMDNHGDRPEVRMASAEGIGKATRFSNTIRQSMMYVALRTESPPVRAAFVRVALPLEQIDGQLADLRRMVWTAAAGTGLAAMLLAFWF